MISMLSSNTSRLIRSSSAAISLSPDGHDRAEALGLPRHGATADAELHAAAAEDVSEGEVLGQAQRVPLGHDVEHLPEPQVAPCGRPSACPNRMRFGSTS